MNILKKILILEQEANNFGFSWENTDQIMAQIQSECLEINEHLEQDSSQINQDKLQEEIGDLLHAAFSLSVFCKLSPEDTLTKTVNKFERRLNAVRNIAAERGLDNLRNHSFDELMTIWHKAKRIAD
jgi:uncharacterized protein YabN with tetrapyrrole methylase and pyrophosphatase domain